MGKGRPARRLRTHQAAAWGLTVLTLAVLAAAARYSAERMLAAFAARLTEELGADAVTEDLARSVHAALEPTHISIWLSE
jgi:hypothetical protein